MRTVIPEVGGFGSRIWAIPDTSLEILWPGPGSGLLIGRPREVGGPVVPIVRGAAYETPAQAQAAVEAFLAPADTDQRERP